MAEFTIRIAGHPLTVHSLFDSTKDYCRKYLTDLPGECVLSVSREELLFEQEDLNREAREEGIRLRTFSDPFLERAAIQRKAAEYLFSHNILLTHGSTVAVDGKAYLFTAGCGTGKSTHTRLWREVFGDRAVMVNDDKPFLQITATGVTAFGAPWSGKHGLDTNMTASLQGICILERGSENRIWRISPEEALPMLLHQSYQPLDAAREPRFREMVIQLAQTVLLWRMKCTKDPEAARTAYSAMSVAR